MRIKVSGRKMLLGGKWVERKRQIEVKNPENNEIIALVPAATASDMLEAIALAKEGATQGASLPIHKRMEILQKAASYIEYHHEEYARTISTEGSKTIREARKEVTRCIETLRISAEEARQIKGETIPFDQRPGSEHRIGYYYRFPIGIVGAITPFNDPLNLVAHKIGPAVASGNAIIVKPASATPLSALKLAEAFLYAGLPEKVLSVITGYGHEIGDVLVSHPDVRMISFTGGVDAGLEISRKAGLKKLSMELGSNSPVIVLDDANIEEAVSSCVSGAFGAAGQNCIGVQRIFIQNNIYHDFLQRFIKQTKRYKTGEKLHELTDVGPLISEKEAIRVEKLIDRCIQAGATVECGGNREGAYIHPTVITGIRENDPEVTEEVFGPVVFLFPVESLDEAISKANAVKFGLQAGIFTNNLQDAFSAISRLDVGGVMINDSSDYRIDAMPFGGVKQSGLGREGVSHSIQEMTDPKVVCVNL
ncbi:aldehyde dehydrogenase family protein [Bacillus alkalicellulosilyticus]|uniref:aldehyde dehydrogenase family protein n=1 Tax=Alkalihalobacterium alkalicellulosilyticum TaxID=1912214 RepID=UPI0009979B63|nr:aldehyde dehydrogenase family protein [Bacillus alkalicellulosilyticus]